MRLTFSFEEIAVDETLKAQLTKKFSVLDKYLTHIPEDIRRGEVRVNKDTRWSYGVRATVPLPGKDVAAEAEDKELLTAVDGVVNKLAAELRKRWEKRRDMQR